MDHLTHSGILVDRVPLKPVLGEREACVTLQTTSTMLSYEDSQHHENTPI